MNLAFPITVNDAPVSAVTVRRPTGADMIVIADHLSALAALDSGSDAMPSSSTIASVVIVAGALTGLGDNAGKLDFADLMSVIAEAATVMGESPASAGVLENGAI